MNGLPSLAARRLPLVLLALVVVLVPAVAVWRSLRGAPEAGDAAPVVAGDSVTLADAARRQAGIGVEPVRTVTRADRFEAPGVLALDERRTARLGSLVEGVVVETSAEVGERVGTGAVLASLHSHVVHDAWADYRKAVAERRQHETELTVAHEAAERAARLFAAGALSERERQRAEADRVAAEEQLDMARTEVRRAEEALEHLGVTNKEDPTGESGEFIPVRSPLSGVVLDKHVTQGTAVTQGQPLYVVSDLRRLWAIAEIDEAQLARVAEDQPAEVRVSAYAGESFPAHVAFVGDVVNPKTRRITVRCEVDNADGRLKPEMYAAIALGASEPREMLVVPSAAIQELQGRPLVFVQEAGGRFVRRDVTLGSEADGLVEVRSGLAEGERVAAAGSFLLKSELLKGTLAEED